MSMTKTSTSGSSTIGAGLAAGPRNILAPVLTHKYLTGWPGHRPPHFLQYMLVGEALRMDYDSDAHFAAYSLPSQPHRLKTAAAPLVQGGVPMTLFIADVDCAASHGAAGGSAATPATDAWWLTEKEKLKYFLSAHPGAFIYRTRGGYRIVMLLAVPLYVTGEAAANAWKRFYLRSLAYISRVFGVEGDPKCADWPHLFRLPHATRDEYHGPERLETIGNPSYIGTWSYSPSEAEIVADEAQARVLALRSEGWRQSLRTLTGTKGTPAPWRPPAPAAIPAVQPEAIVLTLVPIIAGISDGRHSLYNALAGAMCAHVDPSEIPRICGEIARRAGDPKASKRSADAHSTVNSFLAGRPVTGFPTLKQYWPEVAAALDHALAGFLATAPVQSRKTAPPASVVSSSSLPLTPQQQVALLSEKRAQLRQELELSVAFVMSGPARVSTIVGTVGIGKTAAINQRHSTGLPGTLLAASHAALDEREREAEAVGIIHRQRFGGVAWIRLPDGSPACHYIEKIQPIAERGFPVRKIVCTNCPYRQNWDGAGRPCPAFHGPALPGMGFGTHLHAAELLRSDRLTPPVFVDEIPPLIERVDFSLSDLEMLTSRHEGRTIEAWCYPRWQLAAIVIRAVSILLERFSGRRSPFPIRFSGEELHHYLIAAVGFEAQACGWPGTPEQILDGAVAQVESAHQAAPHPPVAEDLGERVRAGVVVAKLELHPEIDEALLSLVKPSSSSRACLVIEGHAQRTRGRVELRRRLLDEWKDSSGDPLSFVLLDATGRDLLPALERALPRHEIRIHDFEVPDSPFAARTYLKTLGLSRGKVLRRGATPAFTAHGAVAVIRALRTALREAFRTGTTVPSLGIVTHQPVAALLRSCIEVLEAKGDRRDARQLETAGAAGILDELRQQRQAGRLGEVSILHYFGQRGSNLLEHVDILLVLGDPWASVGAVREDALFLGLNPAVLGRALMSAEVRQAIGRGRAVLRTERSPLQIYYAGSESPECWSDTEFKTVVLPVSGPLADRRQEFAEDIAYCVAEEFGAVSSAFIRLLAEREDLLDSIGKTAGFPIKKFSYREPCRLSGSDFVQTAGISDRRLSDSISRALPKSTVVNTANPIGHRGCWKWREVVPGAANALLKELQVLLKQSPI